MKKVILIISVFFMFSVAPALADYTIELKNEGGSVLKTYTITTSQVQHLQKAATLSGKSVINQIKEAILDVITQAKASNKARWRADNDAYIDEQSKL